MRESLPAQVAEPHHDWLCFGRSAGVSTGSGDPLRQRKGLLAAGKDVRIAAVRGQGDEIAEGPLRVQAAPAQLVEEQLSYRAVLPALQRAVLGRGHEVVPVGADGCVRVQGLEKLLCSSGGVRPDDVCAGARRLR
jgi:hypothetical protein